MKTKGFGALWGVVLLLLISAGAVLLMIFPRSGETPQMRRYSECLSKVCSKELKENLVLIPDLECFSLLPKGSDLHSECVKGTAVSYQTKLK